MSLNDNSTGGRWTVKEHQKFILGLQMFGKNWKKIQDVVVTRNGAQIRSHAQKYFLKLKKSGINHQDYSEAYQQKVHRPQSPIQGSFIIQVDKQSQNYSYFMSKIVEFTKNHDLFDMWETMIDDGSHKQTVTQIDSATNSQYIHPGIFSHVEQTQSIENRIIKL